MEESPYSIPNSIPPSLVVFSQSGYGDPIRMQRPFGSQVSDGKDGLGGLPNLSPSTFGLRPMDAFPGLPAQLVHLQNPFLHPALESHRLQFGSSTGAFRPIVTTSASANSTHSNNNNNNNNHSGEPGSHNGPGNVKGIPSAFSAPALSTSSRRKLDSIVESVMESRSREQQQAAAASSTSSSGANLDKGYINGQGGGHHSHHPHQQQHRHRSDSPTNSNSSPPQHHQPHHRHHHHQQQHVSGHSRKGERDDGDPDERDENMTPNSELTDRSTPEDLTPPPGNQQQQASKRRRKGNGCDGLSCPVCKMPLRPHDLEAHLLAEVEQIMCMSRLRRQQHLSRDEASVSSSADSPSGSMKKDGGSEISHDSRLETYHRIRANRHSRLRIKTRRRREESGGGAHVTCPVCQVPLQGTNEQFSAHVEACIRKNGDVLDEDEPVDIEGDGDTNDTDEYNWIHNRRVNSRNNPGTAINMTTNSRRRDEDSDMLEVVVDGDETSTYGQPQYTEADIKAAAALASSSSESNNSQKETKNRWLDNDESGGEDLSTSVGNSLSNHDNGNGGGNLVHALKSKVQDLEQKLKGGVSSNCLICMDKYKKPVVSVSCWHVHCEHCWLKSLFNQKLCPQCNAITSASDLRRIFL